MKNTLIPIMAVVAAALLAGCGGTIRITESFINTGKATQALVELCQPHGGLVAYSLAYGQNSLHGATAVCKDSAVVETD